MFTTLLRRSLLSPAFAHRLAAATPGTLRCFARLPQAVQCLHATEEVASEPHQVRKPHVSCCEGTMSCASSREMTPDAALQVATPLTQASEPFGFRVKYDEVSQKNVRKSASSMQGTHACWLTLPWQQEHVPHLWLWRTTPKDTHAIQLQSKLRLDTYLSKRLPDVSRSQLQHGIKLGLVTVNGRVHIQNHKNVRPGDVVVCTLPPPPVTTAIPQVRLKPCASGLRLAVDVPHGFHRFAGRTPV